MHFVCAVHLRVSKRQYAIGLSNANLVWFLDVETEFYNIIQWNFVLEKTNNI
jgi:hypothetical protein